MIVIRFRTSRCPRWWKVEVLSDLENENVNAFQFADPVFIGRSFLIESETIYLGARPPNAEWAQP